MYMDDINISSSWSLFSLGRAGAFSCQSMLNISVACILDILSRLLEVAGYSYAQRSLRKRNSVEVGECRVEQTNVHCDNLAWDNV